MKFLRGSVQEALTDFDRDNEQPESSEQPECSGCEQCDKRENCGTLKEKLNHIKTNIEPKANDFVNRVMAQLANEAPEKTDWMVFITLLVRRSIHDFVIRCGGMAYVLAFNSVILAEFKKSVEEVMQALKGGPHE